MSAPLPASPDELRDWTGDLRQIASVRRITLADGPERGLRALAFSTGGGLDFWVLADRAMDVGPLWFCGMPVAWHHPNGYVAPDLYDAEAAGRTGFERVLSGFVMTCGLDHVRQPAGGHPLHGGLPLTPARLLAHGEDWRAPVPVLHAEGEITSAHLGGTAFRLYRRIEAPIGGRGFSIIDRVENIGTTPQELKLLYHCNFGFPAVTEGTIVRLNGETQFQVRLPDRAAPGRGPDARCLSAGCGATATTELIRPASYPWPGLLVTLVTPTEALPFVQFWSDPRPRRNIVAVEPATCDRAPDGTSHAGPVLDPGSSWSARLDVDFALPAADAKAAE